MIMFKLVVAANENTCFQCKKPIETPDEMTIEHKQPWLSAADPMAAFFDLNNIAFSHHACNVRAASRPTKKYFTAEEKREADLRDHRKANRKAYTPEKRRARYLRTGN